MSSRRPPRWLPILLGVLSAVWLVALPRAAFAGAAGFCDARGVSVELPGPLACVEIAVIAGIADEDVAGFCDLRGATGIAPRPALQGSDGFLDVGPGCNPEIRGGASLDRDAPSPVVIDASPLDRVAPSTDALVLPPAFIGKASFPDHDAYALPRGVRRSVDHPPRALGRTARAPRLGFPAGRSTSARVSPVSFPLARRPTRPRWNARGPPSSPHFFRFARLSARTRGAPHAARSFCFSSKERK